MLFLPIRISASLLPIKLYSKCLQKSGLNIETCDLAALYPDYRINIAAEQQALLQHQMVVFQYPLYWYNMPAILKQYFDSVFTYGFAYGEKGDKLKGKNFVPGITVGAPAQDYRADGKAHFRICELCKNLKQTAYYTQTHYLDPICFHSTSPVLFRKKEILNRAEGGREKLIRLLRTLENNMAN